MSPYKFNHLEWGRRHKVFVKYLLSTFTIPWKWEVSSNGLLNAAELVLLYYEYSDKIICRFKLSFDFWSRGRQNWKQQFLYSSGRTRQRDRGETERNFEYLNCFIDLITQRVYIKCSTVRSTLNILVPIGPTYPVLPNIFMVILNFFSKCLIIQKILVHDIIHTYHNVEYLLEIFSTQCIFMKVQRKYLEPR